MGLFGLFSSGEDKAKKQGILFATSSEIEHVLFHTGLNDKERMFVKSKILKFMGSGGVSVEEFRTRILPELYKSVGTGEISSFDYQKLKKLIYK